MIVEVFVPIEKDSAGSEFYFTNHNDYVGFKGGKVNFENITAYGSLVTKIMKRRGHWQDIIWVGDQGHEDGEMMRVVFESDDGDSVLELRKKDLPINGKDYTRPIYAMFFRPRWEIEIKLPEFWQDSELVWSNAIEK